MLEACCWRPQPATYSNFIVGSVQEVLNAATVPPIPEDLYNSEDRADLLSSPIDRGRSGFPVPENFGVHMASVLDQIIKVRDHYTATDLPGGDPMDQHGFDWMSALAAGIPTGFDFSTTSTTKLPADSIASRLVWNWSYQIKKYRQYRDGEGEYPGDPAAYLDNFRDYYAWSCIMCLGAGFYDTTGMYDLDADGIYRANAYYDEIVGLLSVASKEFLEQQYDEGFKNPDGSNAPPLQISLGLTLQSQQKDHPSSSVDYPDQEPTYGTHCHASTELYIPIDPMSLDKKLNNGTAVALADEE